MNIPQALDFRPRDYKRPGNLVEGITSPIDNRIVPYSVFIDPHSGRVGVTETKRGRKGTSSSIGKMPMSCVARAGTVFGAAMTVALAGGTAGPVVGGR
jgi:pyruvate/2-oxoglutarate dehydrogenase complex dihydrolipoamide dehydrogenase (E3) component